MTTKKNIDEELYASFNASNIYFTEDQSLSDLFKKMNKIKSGGNESNSEFKNNKIIYANENYKHVKKNKCGHCKSITESLDGVTIYESNKVKVVDTCSTCNNEKVHDMDLNNLQEDIKFYIQKKKKR